MNFLKTIKIKISKISTIDKTLILIMIVAMAFLTYSIFMPVPSTIEDGTINSIFRTSATAIFGYMLSGNFGKNIETVKKPVAPLQIGFTSCIGIFCMFCLIAFGFLVPTENVSIDDISSLTMIRDFISSSVGFLIGSPSEN